MEDTEPDGEQHRESSQEFASPPSLYPTILLDDRIANWFSQAEIMDMAAAAPATIDDTSSFIDDGTWENIGDSSFLTSEDEEGSGVSIDHPGLEDTASLEDTEDGKYGNMITDIAVSGSHEEYQNTQDLSDFELHYDYDDNDDDDTESSGLISRTGLQSLAIEFEEPDFYSKAEEVAVMHTIHTFDEEETAKILRHVPTKCDVYQLVATVRQTMTERGLALNEPFRLTYVGDQAYKNVIIDKIGSALAVPVKGTSGPYAAISSNGQSSRFNVVPISSFGDQATREVQLYNSFGPDLIVDECTFASPVKKENRHDTITLALNDHLEVSSEWKDGIYSISTAEFWSLPNITIFFTSDQDDSKTRQTRRIARSFMSRHGVPCIMISAEPLWTKPTEPVTLDHRSVHMCIESRGPSVLDNRVLKRLPIDLDTFLNISAGQMNRNLACLTGLHAGSSTTTSSSARDQKISIGNILGTKSCKEHAVRHTLPKSSMTFWKKPSWNSRTAFIISLLFISIALCITIIAEIHPFLSSQLHLPSVNNNFETYAGPMSPTYGSPISSPPPPSVASVSPTSILFTSPLVSNSAAIFSPGSNLNGFLFDPALLELNKSDSLKVHIVGTNYLILQLPQQLTSLKRKPKVVVAVSRDGIQLSDVQYSELFNGIYAVGLLKNDAHGVLTITVWTTSKPTTQYALEIDTGKPWLWYAGWQTIYQDVLSRLQEGLQTAEAGLKIVYHEMVIHFHGIFKGAINQASVISKETSELKKASCHPMAFIRDLVMKRGYDLSSGISRLTGNASQRLTHNAPMIKQYLHETGYVLSSEVVSRGSNAVASLVRQTTTLIHDVHTKALGGKLSGLRKSKVLAEAQSQAQKLLRKTQHTRSKVFPIRETTTTGYCEDGVMGVKDIGTLKGAECYRFMEGKVRCLVFWALNDRGLLGC
ncbi:MAG: hypothetical protein M1834_003437 [Cirrosporium novae-zelandiae]|nr:MAG: hypothetical protein M1834_003437 [Cirrosporium novae-zelandiae]